jgi:Bacterial PH domain
MVVRVTTIELDVLRNEALVNGCWFAVLASIVLTPTLAFTAPDLGATIAIGVIGLMSALGFYRATRMRVEMTDDGLDVYKLFGTERVAWKDISGVSVVYGGLRIERNDGQVVTVGSMGKPNWASFAGQEVRADRWARQIEARSAAKRLTR